MSENSLRLLEKLSSGDENKNMLRENLYFCATALLVFIIFQGLSLPLALAGPPFKTDDPEPVDYQHWEVYLASQYSHDNTGNSFTAPHLEINYGLAPNLMVHVIAPMVYVEPKGESSHYGYGDTEVGIKYRLFEESDSRPSVGVFPLIEIPTGDESKGLGNGNTQMFLPVWLQKTFDSWTTYGGGGYWINPGTGNKNYWFFGWAVQKEISKFLVLGTEIFQQTSDKVGVDSSTGFNIGAIINFDEMHHLLFSAGRDFSGPNLFSSYIAYQLTF